MTFEHAHTSIDSTPTQRAHQHRVISQENHWNGMVFRKIQIEIVTKKHHVANVRPSRHHQLDSRAHDVENSLQFPHSRYFGRACVGLGYCMCVCVCRSVCSQSHWWCKQPWDDNAADRKRIWVRRLRSAIVPSVDRVGRRCGQHIHNSHTIRCRFFIYFDHPEFKKEWKS